MRKILVLISLLSSMYSVAQITDTAGARLYINTQILPNNANSITGAKMNTALNGILNSLRPLLNTKVDSVWSSGSQLFVRKNGNTQVFNINAGVSLQQFVDSIASLTNRIIDSSAQLRASIAANNPVYTQDFVINGPAGTMVGVLGNGDTIKATGKTLDEVMQMIAIKAVAPTYVAPTVSVNGSPAPGNYERGTNLGTITLSRTFTQNDAGAVGADTYAKYVTNWNNLGSNTDAISSLTEPIYYRVTTAYAQGACKNNNVGQQDCTGRINAGSVTSGNILYNPFDKRYWGFADSQAPGNASILALSQDNSGSTGTLSLTNQTITGSKYFVYFTKGSVSSVTFNGIPATGAFTITTYTVTNAQGYSSTYSYVYSNNPLTGTISSIVIN